MEVTPLLSALIALVDVAIVEGIDAALNAVAAIAAPRQRFLSQSWFAAVGGRKPRTIIARRADGSASIALPVVSDRLGITTVPGCYWPYRSFPVADDLEDGEMAALLRSPAARRAIGPVLRLGPIYADDPALGAVRRVASGAGWTLLQRRIATAFTLDIGEVQAEGAWPRASTLKKNRFHEKHLASHGALDWRYVTGSGWTDAIFDDLATIERRSWVGRTDGADAKFLATGTADFWRRLATDPAQAARMWAAILYVDGAPSAFSFDLDVGTTKYAIANSYDPALAKHSPGKCLYYRNLVTAIEQRGIRLVDWGAGDSGYKSTIGATAGAEIVDCLLVRGRLPGAVARWPAALWERSGQRATA